MFPTNDMQKLTIALAAATLLGGGLAACGKTESTASLLAEAKQFQAKGDSKAAVIQLKNAIGKSPDNADARLALGELYGSTGDPVSAEKELRKAKELGVPAAKVAPALTSCWARAAKPCSRSTSRTRPRLPTTRRSRSSRATRWR
jgi:tetratricopeptide (TPR) repeat protein